jgi:hypothetical protein
VNEGAVQFFQMNKIHLSLIITAIGLAAAAGQPTLPVDYPYSPAFISTISAPEGHAELVIFPFRGKALKIPIRSAVSLIYGSDGRSLYGQCTPHADPAQVALCKIELTTLTTTAVPGSTGLYVHDFVVSNDERVILASGTRGLFALDIPAGIVRTLIPQQDKNPKSSWGHLSLSPDAKRADATRNGRVEVIEMDHGSVQALVGAFFIGAWSPDSKWLAVTEKGEKGRTILLDAKTLMRQRTPGPSELDWSPDSRYLLRFRPCDAYSGTLEVIEVESGKRTSIESSKCQVNQATTGWVRNDIQESLR